MAGNSGNRALEIANALAVAAAFGLAASWQRRLPARFPAHYNFAGEVDRWAEADSFEWWLMPICAAVLAILLAGLARLAATMSAEYINLPRKETFLAMSEEQQLPVRQLLTRMVLQVALLNTLLFVSIHWMSFSTATETSTTPAVSAMIAIGVLLVGAMVATARAVNAIVRSHEPAASD